MSRSRRWKPSIPSQELLRAPTLLEGCHCSSAFLTQPQKNAQLNRHCEPVGRIFKAGEQEGSCIPQTCGKRLEQSGYGARSPGFAQPNGCDTA
ncbi:hypothetical protein NN561_013761 [Cricetulus griseus]